ncbi:hypothetical protein OTU49_000680, partial [Cherax quadricarinatus]
LNLLALILALWYFRGVLSLAAVSSSEAVDQLPALLDEYPDRAEGLEKWTLIRWPNKTVPILKDNIYPPFDNATAYLHTVTCVRIEDKFSEGGKFYVKMDASQCLSHVGYNLNLLAYQELDLGPHCYERLGNIFHGLYHTLGILHPQNRPDRDDYIFVNLSNIEKKYHNILEKTPGYYGFLSTMGLPYDYASVMHLAEDGFRTSGMRALAPWSLLYSSHSTRSKAWHDSTVEETVGSGLVLTLLKYFPGTVGQRMYPSRGDLALLNRFYECWDYYLGDDIPGAIPYKLWHAKYLTP